MKKCSDLGCQSVIILDGRKWFWIKQVLLLDFMCQLILETY